MREDKSFLRFELRTQAIAIGERVKGGIFRPCTETIPTSALKGSFNYHFGSDTLAIGFFREGTYKKDIFTYAPFDVLMGTAKLPISLEYLKPTNGTKAVMADIYAAKDGVPESLIKATRTEISLGALRNKGFGRCEIEYAGEVKPDSRIGYLRGRLLEEECRPFRITNIIQTHYGYLFYPKSKIGGVYKRALFEGSIIEGPEFLIKKEYKYD